MKVNQQYYKYWKDVWSSQSEEVLDATALIRVMECTNGCVQHAFRDGDERALSVEQSRECMKLSMGTIKSKVLPLPCLLYTSPSPRDQRGSRMPSSA